MTHTHVMICTLKDHWCRNVKLGIILLQAYIWKLLENGINGGRHQSNCNWMWSIHYVITNRGDPGVVVHYRRSSLVLGIQLSKKQNVVTHPHLKIQYCGKFLWPSGTVLNLRPSCFESCVWKAVSYDSSHRHLHSTQFECLSTSLMLSEPSSGGEKNVDKTGVWAENRLGEIAISWFSEINSVKRTYQHICSLF